MSEVTDERAYALARAESWRKIEDKHFGQCIWQQRSRNGKAFLEGLIHKASGQIMIIEKGYETRLPPENSSKPFPSVSWVNVYAAIDRATNTWDGLDVALTEFKA